MNIAVVATIISGAVSLAVATVTYLLTKKREREAEWRKLKLDHYREFLRRCPGSFAVAPRRRHMLAMRTQ